MFVHLKREHQSMLIKTIIAVIIVSCYLKWKESKKNPVESQSSNNQWTQLPAMDYCIQVTYSSQVHIKLSPRNSMPQFLKQPKYTFRLLKLSSPCFTKYNGIQQSISNRKMPPKNTLPNNVCVIEEVSGETSNYFEVYGNENTIHQIVWDEFNKMLRQKLLAMNMYFRKDQKG